MSQLKLWKYRQAIPPAYTEFIGGFLMDQIRGVAA